ncbi:hypothetical protein PAXINDRAFT_156137 [Paxillus involutus ATCC 200175]|uniref:Uncharacterized protein n=1 Tax=Paxillus involutus ATCC 200175 TaxID=664439 RepID=A0A0C9U427_PAXIN|nr:hypothetical protein PAXINDRAFT_156137 [Paxillus involutus ATCC 200175]
MACFICCANVRTLGYSSEAGVFQIMARGTRPEFKKKVDSWQTGHPVFLGVPDARSQHLSNDPVDLFRGPIQLRMVGTGHALLDSQQSIQPSLAARSQWAVTHMGPGPALSRALEGPQTAQLQGPSTCQTRAQASKRQILNNKVELTNFLQPVYQALVIISPLGDNYSNPAATHIGHEPNWWGVRPINQGHVMVVRTGLSIHLNLLKSPPLSKIPFKRYGITSHS